MKLRTHLQRALARAVHGINSEGNSPSIFHRRLIEELEHGKRITGRRPVHFSSKEEVFAANDEFLKEFNKNGHRAELIFFNIQNGIVRVFAKCAEEYRSKHILTIDEKGIHHISGNPITALLATLGLD